MSVLSKLKMPRPGQLLALVLLALLLGVLVFALLPNGAENMVVAAYKAWLISMFVALGLAVDQIVFHYARPGAFTAHADRTVWLACMQRRAIVIGAIVLAGGLAL
ncbi:MAG: putative holin [Proteobacteria bacterium]|nr:putative holin [Pseudomonadota bacterium]MBU1594257.1 putative holin [Pseudomonadota bacterium]